MFYTTCTDFVIFLVWFIPLYCFCLIIQVTSIDWAASHWFYGREDATMRDRFLVPTLIISDAQCPRSFRWYLPWELGGNFRFSFMFKALQSTSAVCWKHCCKHTTQCATRCWNISFLLCPPNVKKHMTFYTAKCRELFFLSWKKSSRSDRRAE